MILHLPFFVSTPARVFARRMAIISLSLKNMFTVLAYLMYDVLMSCSITKKRSLEVKRARLFFASLSFGLF